MDTAQPADFSSQHNLRARVVSTQTKSSNSLSPLDNPLSHTVNRCIASGRRIYNPGCVERVAGLLKIHKNTERNWSKFKRPAIFPSWENQKQNKAHPSLSPPLHSPFPSALSLLVPPPRPGDRVTTTTLEISTTMSQYSTRKKRK